MADLLLDAMNVIALNGYVQNIAKIRETCKEASQLEILNERFEAEYDEWYTTNYATCIECAEDYKSNGLTICTECYWNIAYYERQELDEDFLREEEYIRVMERRL